MPHSRSLQTSHGGQTYPEKEKVKAAAKVEVPSLSLPVDLPGLESPAFKGTGAQLLALVSSQFSLGL